MTSTACRTYQPKPRTSFESFLFLLFKGTTAVKTFLFGGGAGVLALPTAVEVETQFALQVSNRLVHPFHQEVSFTLFHLAPNGFFLSLIFSIAITCWLNASKFQGGGCACRSDS
jgi:hypothetical protein